MKAKRTWTTDDEIEAQVYVEAAKTLGLTPLHYQSIDVDALERTAGLETVWCHEVTVHVPDEWDEK